MYRGEEIEPAKGAGLPPRDRLTRADTKRMSRWALTRMWREAMGGLAASLLAFTATVVAAESAKVLPLPGEQFSVGGRPAFLIAAPKVPPEASKPWVWYAPTL